MSAPLPAGARAPAPQPPLRPLQALGVLAMCAICGLGGAAITFLGSQALVNAARLSIEGVLADGAVTDSRVMQSSRQGTSYEIRYAFSVPGDPLLYTHEDETGRTNLWVSLDDEEVWRLASSTRRVQIEYLPRDPHVSRPVRGTGASFGGDQAAGLCLGLALLIPSLLIGLGTVWGQIRRLRGA